LSTYVLGDIHGCFRTLERLLETIEYDKSTDRIWLVGDLVNRGPASLEVLRWAVAQGDRLVTVLGNHDLHLLGRAAGVRREQPGDTLQPILEASDRTDLLSWLRTRPFIHRQDELVLVHAGLLPEWSVETAEKRAGHCMAWLSNDEDGEFLDRVFASEPGDRVAHDANVFTRLRICSPDGSMIPTFGGTREQMPEGAVPWFELPDRHAASHTIIYGHWAALGLNLLPGIVGLDSGCVWGGVLTALRLEDQTLFQQPTLDGP
jgi:bis(5'-nucleosyl)-tetraphosphatase (symmetrical)